jgi:hypothetical protein
MYKTDSVATLKRGRLQALNRPRTSGKARPSVKEERREMEICFFMDALQAI